MVPSSIGWTRGFHPLKEGSIPLGTAIIAFYVYLIVTKIDKAYSYVGYTNNLAKRIKLHNNSKGAKFTKGRKWKIAYYKRFKSKIKALKEEYKLKKNYKLRSKIKKIYSKNENISITSI